MCTGGLRCLHTAHQVSAIHCAIHAGTPHHTHTYTTHLRHVGFPHYQIAIQQTPQEASRHGPQECLARSKQESGEDGSTDACNHGGSPAPHVRNPAPLKGTRWESQQITQRNFEVFPLGHSYVHTWMTN